MAQEEMNAQQLEDAAKAEALKAKEAADEAAKAENKADAEKAAKKALAAAEKATKLIKQLEEKKDKEAAEQALVSAETAGSAPVVDPEKEEAQRRREHAMELVPIQLFRDEERYKDDVPVFVNGQRMLIKRGVPVMVPRYVAEVVKNSQLQDSQTEAMMARLVEDYEHNTAEKTKPYSG